MSMCIIYITWFVSAALRFLTLFGNEENPIFVCLCFLKIVMGEKDILHLGLQQFVSSSPILAFCNVYTPVCDWVRDWLTTESIRNYFVPFSFPLFPTPFKPKRRKCEFSRFILILIHFCCLQNYKQTRKGRKHQTHILITKKDMVSSLFSSKQKKNTNCTPPRI